jgi:cell division inhibitor SepF
MVLARIAVSGEHEQQFCLEQGSREEDTGSMADGIFDKVKRVIGIDDEEPDQEELEDTNYDSPVNRGEQQPQPVPNYTQKGGSNDFVAPPPRVETGKVVSMQSASATVAAKKQQWKMLITEPKDFDDCPGMVDSLLESKPLIINLEKLEREKARKIFDFLSGAIYAIGGRVQKVSENIFVFAPGNVDILLSPNGARGRNSSDNIYMYDAPWRN